MAVKKPDFALDMTPVGVNLWRRSRSGDWLGLGFVRASDENFTQAIEALRLSAVPEGRPSAEIRIPRSEVYFTRIDADQVPNKPADEAILALVADRIPFRDKSARMIVDSCRRGSGDLAVAIVPASILEEAAAFAGQHGFEARYFTTLNNPMTFPAEPRFLLTAPARPLPNLTPVARPRRSLALAAAAAFVLVGLALTGKALIAPSLGHLSVERAGSLELPAVALLQEPQLHQPDGIANDSTSGTPVFAADVAAPQSLPAAPLQIALVPDEQIAGGAEQPGPATAAAPPPVRTSAVKPGFERSGLANRTRKLLNESMISIEQPPEGELGRKTIRILPTDLGKGSQIRRFDPGTFTRVAQAQTANDASGLPDVENDLLMVTEDGVPLFQGPPAAVPPARPGTPAESEDESLKAFSDGIAGLLDETDGAAQAPAGQDVSGIRVQTASLGTIRPRPNPFRGQTGTPAAASDSAYPVQTASAATLRPKPRPASLVRRLQQRDIDAAAQQAAQEAIRESMPTVNALFVSLLPKPRPDNIQAIVEGTRPGLTTAKTRTNAVVRAAPTGGGQNSGTMKTSNTPKSVAALATESARISKNSLSLIGIFGTSSARRALLRLPTGRYIKVKQGDDVSGWTVSAIGESSVRIKRGSRDEVLRMPE